MIVAELTLPAGPDVVWRHLREPALIKRWFGWDYDGLDGEIDVIFVEGAVADEEARTLTFGYGDRFELDGSTLCVFHEGPEEGFDDIGEGWISFVQQLRFALARHPGEERATHYLSADEPKPVIAALEAMGGEVWFRSEHQIGVVVAGLSDGLLVAMEKPGAAAHLTLSAYGDATRELPLHTARWDGWWAELA